MPLLLVLSTVDSDSQHSAVEFGCQYFIDVFVMKYRCFSTNYQCIANMINGGIWHQCVIYIFRVKYRHIIPKFFIEKSNLSVWSQFEKLAKRRELVTWLKPSGNLGSQYNYNWKKTLFWTSKLQLKFLIVLSVNYLIENKIKYQS